MSRGTCLVLGLVLINGVFGSLIIIIFLLFRAESRGKSNQNIS